MTPEEEAVIEAALAWRESAYRSTHHELEDALEALEKAGGNGQRIDHPFQPHHLAGSGIAPYSDYCIEAVQPGMLRGWVPCGRPRAEHAS